MQPLHRRLIETEERPRRAALFYRLGPRQAAPARRALAAGLDVICFGADPAVAAELGDEVRVRPREALLDFDDGVEERCALDLAEFAAEELCRRRAGIVRGLARIAGSEDVRLYVARSILRDVGDLLGLAMLCASDELSGYEAIELDEQWPGGADYAFLVEVIQRCEIDLRAALRDALDRMSFVDGRRSFEQRWRTALRAAATTTALWRGYLSRLRPTASRLDRRPLMIRTYAEDWGIDRGGQRRLRNFDFVVDGETLRPADVAVWAEDDVPAERDALLAARGYAVVRGEVVTVGPLGLLARGLPTLLRATALAGRLAVSERWWQEPFRTLVAQVLLWREIGAQAQPRAFLFYNDLHPSGVARTLALRRSGCICVQYEHASSWALDEHGWVPDFVFAFNVVDAMVTWGPEHSELLRRHRGAIGEIWEVGCLWSEHARVVRDDLEMHRRYRVELEQRYGLDLAAAGKVVAVFDTSAAPRLLGYDDLVAFYEGVAALAECLPDVLFLCKPKRPLGLVFVNGTGGTELEARLASAPNVVLLDELFESGAVIALCDASVNACYTSPAIETIGAGRPSVYFDPTSELSATTLPCRIPRFVARNADELSRVVAELLALDPDDRAADLRERFSGLEGHFDGRAITRLRERLRAVTAG